MTLSPVSTLTPWLGCDPEFFFKLNNRVIGSEKVIGDALSMDIEAQRDWTDTHLETESRCICDGVQAELNPRPNTCRANLANEIAAQFRVIKAKLDENGQGVSVDFSQSVKISKTELSKLDEKNQKFGCDPSYNAYGDNSAKLAAVDPLTDRNRSAGGHIHIGLTDRVSSDLKERVLSKPHELVNLLDIICGNTCVLVDRDPGNIRRRKLYGYAGEYRLPAHGIEYRTLSNFWLRSYHLMSLAFGLARYSLEVYAMGDDYYREFVSRVDMDDVQKAINKNNFNLAMNNFECIEPLIRAATRPYEHFPIHGDNITKFKKFALDVRDHGLDKFFPEDPLEHWCSLPEAHDDGFSTFLKTNY